MTSKGSPSNRSQYTVNLSGDEDDILDQIDSYQPNPNFHENVEKSLTNLNINLAAVAGEAERIKFMFDEFCKNFLKQHDLLVGAVDAIRKEARNFGKDIKAVASMDDDDDA